MTEKKVNGRERTLLLPLLLLLLRALLPLLIRLLLLLLSVVSCRRARLIRLRLISEGDER